MAFAGFGLAAAVGISGCGSSSGAASGETGSGGESGGTPKDKVVAAFQNLEESSNAGFTLALDGTYEDFKKIEQAQPDSGAPLDASSEKALKQAFKGKITMNMSAPDGKTFGDTVASSSTQQDAQALLQDPAALEAALKGQGSFAMSVVLENSGLFEFVTKDGVIYVRADAKKIATMADQNLGSLESQLGGLPPVVANPVKKLLAGQWVSLDLIQTVKLLDEQGVLDQLPKETASPAVDQAKLQAFLNSLKAAFQADAQIVETEATDQGDGYQVTVPAKKIAKAVQDDLISLVGSESAKEIKKEISEMPNDNYVFDVYVQDDKLSGVNLDITQFLEKPVKGTTFGVNLDVDADASAVQVPGNATAVDIKGILNLIPANAFSAMGQGL